MVKARDELVETICIGICDGYDGRCQRYPGLSRTCPDFYPLEKAYKAGIREVVEWIEARGQNIYSNDTRESYVLAINKKEWQTQLKEWGIEQC